MSAAELFHSNYSRPPEGVFSAPGRVNLIGEHTDYTGGLVLPFAIDARAFVAAARTDEPTVCVVSAQRPGPVIRIALADITAGPTAAARWPSYLLGSIWALAKAGYPIGGIELALDSEVPPGAGLSSSAAVECVTTLAASALAGVRLTPLEIARLAQQAENDFVGVPCGPMDQTASAAAQEGSVLLFDTGSGSVEQIPFDPAANGLAILVVDTRVSHSLADGEYGRRRSSCEEATRVLGVRSLGGVQMADLPAALERLGDDELRRRVRHVVTENARVSRTADLLRAGRIADIGDLLTASHTSLRDDYEVSCPELDQAVLSALDAGALGARMTGGGFGGSAIALLPAGLIDSASAAIRDSFADRGFASPVLRTVSPSAGARRDD